MVHQIMVNKKEADLVPCVYVKFPPRPVPRAEADKMEYCFRSPISLALFGYGNGYSARTCEPPPSEICREFDWFEERRKEEENTTWAWFKGPNIFHGPKNVELYRPCKLDSDCKGFPYNLCFGYDSHSSICADGRGADLGEPCNFDRQCQIKRVNGLIVDVKPPICDFKIEPHCPEIHTELLCHNYICVARTNCRKYRLPSGHKFLVRIYIDRWGNKGHF